MGQSSHVLLSPAAGRPGAAGEGAAALSAREREVAELVAEGKTNREIASRLFISRRTVDTHLTRILEKLGVPKRAGVARALGDSRSETSAPRTP